MFIQKKRKIGHYYRIEFNHQDRLQIIVLQSQPITYSTMNHWALLDVVLNVSLQKMHSSMYAVHVCQKVQLAKQSKNLMKRYIFTQNPKIFIFFIFSTLGLLQFKSTLDRVRARKKATNFATDVDFDDAVDSIKRRNRFDLDSFDDSSASKASSSVKKSTFKVSEREREINYVLFICRGVHFW